jgi:hypothetical protein
LGATWKPGNSSNDVSTDDRIQHRAGPRSAGCKGGSVAANERDKRAGKELGLNTMVHHLRRKLLAYLRAGLIQGNTSHFVEIKQARSGAVRRALLWSILFDGWLRRSAKGNCLWMPKHESISRFYLGLLHTFGTMSSDNGEPTPGAVPSTNKPVQATVSTQYKSLSSFFRACQVVSRSFLDR